MLAKRGVLVVCLAVLAACQAAPVTSPAAWSVTAPPAAGLNGVLSAAGAPQAGDNELDLALTDAAGQPVKDAVVQFDFDMTNMSMGQNAADAPGDGQGHYRARVHFSMDGPWRVIARVRRPGQAEAALRFEFSVKLP